MIKNAPRRDIIAAYKQSNLFVNTSLKEVAPIVMLEAMAASLTWIACDVGNVAGLKGGKYIRAPKDNTHHVMFDEQTKEQFIKNITDLLKKPTLGEDGRMQVEEEFTWDKVLASYSSIIES